MSDATQATIVALLRADPRPTHLVAAELESEAAPDALLERALSGGRRDGQQSLLGSGPDPGAAIATAQCDLETWRAEGIMVATVCDDSYPLNLRAVHDRPALVFMQGPATPPDLNTIAVIGSRRPTPAGRDRAASLATELVAAGFTIASGLAAGIDTAAHTAALAAGGRTFAVLGTGLHHSYPPENAALQQRLATDQGLISGFEPDTPPSRDTFPQRNGLMSGLSLASVIVEASVTSGARIQARLALAHGRPVFIAAELLAQTWAHRLAQRPGVHAFTSASEITDHVRRLTGATLTA